MKRSHSAISVLNGLTDQLTPTRDRETTLSRFAELKLKRDRDLSQAMKDHEEAKRQVLAKTARLRAERLAREANAASAKLPVPARKQPAAAKR